LWDELQPSHLTGPGRALLDRRAGASPRGPTLPRVSPIRRLGREGRRASLLPPRRSSDEPTTHRQCRSSLIRGASSGHVRTGLLISLRSAAKSLAARQQALLGADYRSVDELGSCGSSRPECLVLVVLFPCCQAKRDNYQACPYDVGCPSQTGPLTKASRRRFSPMPSATGSRPTFAGNVRVAVRWARPHSTPRAYWGSSAFFA
jgi:hypothetical protein